MNPKYLAEIWIKIQNEDITWTRQSRRDMCDFTQFHGQLFVYIKSQLFVYIDFFCL